jgi:hypothetical protein
VKSGKPVSDLLNGFMDMADGVDRLENYIEG